MTGPLALIGGMEHMPGCEPIDRRLLAATATRFPIVTVLPFASSRRTQDRTIERAVSWWTGLGADVLVVHEPDVRHYRPAIEIADILVLTGGVPDRLYRRLAGSQVWDHLVRRWRQGAALSGSSSGAMVAAAWRQSVWPPFGIIPGLGLVPQIAAAPHHDTRALRAAARLRTRTHPDLRIVGIDDHTALLYVDGRFEVEGQGRVTLLHGEWSQVYQPGEEIPAAAMGLMPDWIDEHSPMPVEAELLRQPAGPGAAHAGHDPFDKPAAAAGA